MTRISHAVGRNCGLSDGLGGVTLGPLAVIRLALGIITVLFIDRIGFIPAQSGWYLSRIHARLTIQRSSHDLLGEVLHAISSPATSCYVIMTRFIILILQRAKVGVTLRADAGFALSVNDLCARMASYVVENTVDGGSFQDTVLMNVFEIVIVVALLLLHLVLFFCFLYLTHYLVELL